MQFVSCSCKTGFDDVIDLLALLLLLMDREEENNFLVSYLGTYAGINSNLTYKFNLTNIVFLLVVIDKTS